MNIIELMKSGKWINGITPEIEQKLAATEDLCFLLNSLAPSCKKERDRIIRKIMGHIGNRYVLHSPFHCDFGTQISIGENFVGNFNLTILDEAEVIIGNNVFIGPNVSIYTVEHAINPSQRNEGIMRSQPVHIGDNVWIGGNVTILPGVSIGNNSVIGAGSVVTKDIPPSVLAVGNPCFTLRALSDTEKVTVTFPNE